MSGSATAGLRACMRRAPRRPLADPDFFAQVRVDDQLGTVVWSTVRTSTPLCYTALRASLTLRPSVRAAIFRGLVADGCPGGPCWNRTNNLGLKSGSLVSQFGLVEPDWVR